VTARKLSGLSCSDNPPTFHEIRSLSGRIYEAAYGKEFAQKLFGHKSEKMTEMYLTQTAERVRHDLKSACKKCYVCF
jgi:integrase